MIMNSKGERGNPCLNTLLLWKKGFSWPLNNGAIHGVLTHEAIQDTKLVQNQNSIIILKRKEIP